MQATCPSCGNEHENPEWHPGQVFTCLCGEQVTVPRPRGFGQRLEELPSWTVVALVVGIAGTPLLCLVGAAAAFFVPKWLTAQKVIEARVGVYELCQRELEHRARTGQWLAAGPGPKFVPPGFKVNFGDDPNFKTLGFERDQVLYQYQVVLQEEGTALCFARGDLDNDGESSTYSVTARPNGTVDRMLVTSADE